MVTKLGDLNFSGRKDLMEKQLELEAEMLNRGKRRYDKKQQQSIDSGNESLTTHGKSLLKRSFDVYITEMIKEFGFERKGPKLRAHKLLIGMDAKAVAVIAIKRIIDSISINVPRIMVIEGTSNYNNLKKIILNGLVGLSRINYM